MRSRENSDLQVRVSAQTQTQGQAVQIIFDRFVVTGRVDLVRIEEFSIELLIHVVSVGVQSLEKTTRNGNVGGATQVTHLVREAPEAQIIALGNPLAVSGFHVIRSFVGRSGQCSQISRRLT